MLLIQSKPPSRLRGRPVGIVVGWGALHVLHIAANREHCLRVASPLHLVEALGIAVLAGLTAGAFPRGAVRTFRRWRPCAMTSPHLELRSLRKSYDDGRIEALRGVDLR